MLGRGPAAPADQRRAVLAGEDVLSVGKFLRREGIRGAVGAELRQAGVGHHRQQQRRVTRQVAEVLAHLGRTGGAVQADHVDSQRGQCGERGADLAAQQHRTGQLYRDRHQHGHAAPGGSDGPPCPDDRGLGLEEILGGLHQHRVGAAGEHPFDLRLVGVTQRRVRGVPERRQLRARPDAAEHPARPLGGGPPIGHLAREPRAGLGKLEDASGDAVLAEVGKVGTEGVGLDRVAPDGEVGVVDAADDVGPGDVENLVAAFVALEVVECQPGGLQHRPHRAIGDDDAFMEGSKQAGAHSFRLMTDGDEGRVLGRTAPVAGDRHQCRRVCRCRRAATAAQAQVPLSSTAGPAGPTPRPGTGPAPC